MRALAALAAALVIAVLAVGQALLPGLMAGRLEAALAAGLPGSESVRVQVSGFPALQMLQGRFAYLEVDVAGLRHEGLRIDRMHLEGRGLLFEPGESGGYEIKQAESLEARVELTEADLNAYLAGHEELGGAVSLRLTEPAGAAVQTGVEILGARVSFSVQGVLEAEGGAVVFKPQGGSAGGTPFSDGVSQWLEGFFWQLDLSQGPLRFHVERVEVQGNRLLLTGRSLLGA